MVQPYDGYQTVKTHMNKKMIILNNFLGGLSWGFGTVIGATVVVAMLLGFLRIINVVPVVGNFVSDVMQVVNQNQAQTPFRR